MARVFLGLSFGTMLLLTGAAASGFWVQGHFREIQHVVLSILAALFACLVHVVTFTYFTATGKMIRQAVFIGGLDVAMSEGVSKLKAGVAKPMALGVFSLIITLAVGGFMAHQRALHWVHTAAALLAIYANGWGFLRQYRLILENSALMERAMTMYNRRKEQWKAAGIQNTEFKTQKAEAATAGSQAVGPAQDSLQM